MASIQEIRIVSDAGAGIQGAREGVRMLSAALPTWGFSSTLAPIEVTHTSLAQPLFKEAKHITSFTSFITHHLMPSLELTLQAGHFPFLISGDHSNALGIIAALQRVYQVEKNEKVGILWIDAHADLHTPYTSPSGNLHGMPLGAALHLPQPTHTDYPPIVQKLWKDLNHLAPAVLPQHLCILGLRSFEDAEADTIAQYGIKTYSATETQKKGTPQVMEEIQQYFQDIDRLYVSWDVDSLDATLIPSTGTPVSEGFQKEDIIHILAFLLHLPQLSAWEITEFNPTLDNAQKTGYHTLQHIMQKIIPLLVDRKI